MTRPLSLPTALATLASALLLQACGTLESSPSQTTLTMPAQWTAAASATPSPPTIHSSWWSELNDPVLNSLVEQVLASNLDLQVAAARVKEARAMAHVQEAAQLPNLDFSMGGQRSRSISAALGQPVVGQSTQPQLLASYEVDVWGRIANQRAAANAQWLASAAAQDSAKLSMVATTVASYLELRGLDAQLSLAERTLGVREQALKLARSREQAGYSSALDTQQSEAEYYATAQAIPQIQQAIVRHEHALNLLAGQAPRPVARGKDLAELQLPRIPEVGVPSQLLQRRPDLAAAQEQLIASDASLAVAKARLLPSVQLSASLGGISSSLLHGDPFTLWSLGGSILAPLFDGNRLQSMVTAADAQREQALASYQKAVLTAFAEVEDQLSAITRLDQQLQQAQAQQGALEKAVRLANNRYREGYVSYLDALDAQRNLFSVQQSVLQLQTDRLIAATNLYRALGGGWDSANLHHLAGE